MWLTRLKKYILTLASTARIFIKYKLKYYLENIQVSKIPYFIKYSAWKVAEKKFKMAFMMNKLAMILILVKLFLKNKINFLTKNHCEIQVCAIRSLNTVFIRIVFFKFKCF